MNFFSTLQENFEKLDNFSTVLEIWKEVIQGKSQLKSEHVIEYSFHYPVDTDVYLEELKNKYDDCMKEDLRTIDGNLKAYLQTFLYYCMSAGDRISINTSLHAAEIYMKILLLPSEIGKLYFEKQMYKAVLNTILLSVDHKDFPEEHTIALMKLVFRYTTYVELEVQMFKITCHMFSMVMIKRGHANADDVKRCENITTYAFWCLRELIITKDDPTSIKCIMSSLLSVFRFKPFEKIQNSRPLTVLRFKIFIIDFLEKQDVDDRSKLHYFVDSLFNLWSTPDFDCIEDCIDIVNRLDEKLYKDLLRKIPNYLESKNHTAHYGNLMRIIYYMLLKLPENLPLDKLDVLFSVCLNNTVLHFLNKNKRIQDHSIETMARIFEIDDENPMMKKIFELSNSTGKIASLKVDTILSALYEVVKKKYVGNVVHTKNILVILSKLLVSVEGIDKKIGAQIIFLLVKDFTPFSLKPFLPILHELYCKLALGRENHVCRQILRTFFKNALHQDNTSKDFLQHLYDSLVFPSTIKGKQYSPELYSNMFLTDEFEFSVLFEKCSANIKYSHVCRTITNFDYLHEGHAMLLNSLLDFVAYKEHGDFTDYILENYTYMCGVQHAGWILKAFNRILRNRNRFDQEDVPKFDTIHTLLWETLYQQTFVVCNIQSAFDLIDTLKNILRFPEDDRTDDLLLVTTEKAYRALTLNRDYIGCVMYLTQMCVVLKKLPREEILDIFENVINTPETMHLLRNHCQESLVQIVSFFSTIGLMNRTKVPKAIEIMIMAMDTDDTIVKITALKLLYGLCREVTHEYEQVIRFAFKYITDPTPGFSRLCVTILEELIHENYLLLNSEDFLRFVYGFGNQTLMVFMTQILEPRFMLSNRHDIYKFYLTTVVYISNYTKFENYPLSEEFQSDLRKIRILVDSPNELFSYLFKSIPLKNKFNILKEISSVFDNFMLGYTKVDENLFTFLKHALFTFKIMCSKTEFNYNRTYYAQVCKDVEKQLVHKDNKFKDATFYGEYEQEVKQCTIMLFKLLFFLQLEDRMSEIVFPAFDALVCWIDHIKPEMVHYIHYEKGKDYDVYLNKLLHFYKTNREKLDNIVNNQER